MTSVFLPGIVMKAMPVRSLQPPWGFWNPELLCIAQPSCHTFLQSVVVMRSCWPDLSTQTKAPFPDMQSGCCLHLSCRSWGSGSCLLIGCTLWTRDAERNCRWSHYRVSGLKLQLKYLACWLPHWNSFPSALSNYCYFFLFRQLQGTQKLCQGH